MKLTDEQISTLSKPLPAWSVKDHPTKTGMSAIHPMAIIDRLNEVFGIGGWSFTTEYLSCEETVQKVKVYVDKKWNGQYKDRQVFVSTVKGRIEVDDLVIEQFGGNTNDDKGDALKGGATDALTKIASYLGIGASIYKGMGNTTNSTTNNAPEGSQSRINDYKTNNRV